MRLLHVINSLDPRGGGPSEGVRQLGAELRGKGHARVEVVTGDRPSDPWLAEFPLPVHALGPRYLGYGYLPRLMPWLKQHAREYDAVIVNGIWQYGAFATWRALRASPTPYFVFPHGMLDPWFKRNYPLKHLKKWLYWPWADYRVLRDARAVLFTCEEERLLARQSFWLYRCREKVVSYGTKGPPENAAAQKAAYYARFPKMQECRVLLFLSRIHEKKGVDLLIRAFAAIQSSERPGSDRALHLVIGGPCADAAYLTKLRQLATDLCTPDSVSFPGMLSGDVKWGAFRSAEAFVLPSHQENFGIAVVEALACGTPVLISNQVNIWREIEADGAGLVADDTIEGTTALLQQWAQLSDKTRHTMRGAACRSFERRFEIEQAAEKLLQTVTESLDPHQTVNVEA